jgi:hypothetical protein
VTVVTYLCIHGKNPVGAILVSFSCLELKDEGGARCWRSGRLGTLTPSDSAKARRAQPLKPNQVMPGAATDALVKRIVTSIQLVKFVVEFID